MSLTKDDVKKIGRLARLHVADEQCDSLADELGNILNFVEQLSEVDTGGVALTNSPVKHKMRLRDDVITAGNEPELVLKNAPDGHMDFYTVPKVVE